MVERSVEQPVEPAIAPAVEPRPAAGREGSPAASSAARTRTIVVMPAYNAARTLARIVAQIPAGCADEIVVVDDASRDDTARIAATLPVTLVRHERNLGYGGNQKTCYRAALDAGADVVIMLHPDYQYDPRLVRAMASMIAEGIYQVVIASRILGGRAIAGGMPRWKYFSNRVLTLAENVLVGAKLSEYHTGYRAFSRRVLETLPLAENSEDFVFDNQMLVQTVWFGFDLAEVSCPTRYNHDASSINFRRSVRYGFGCLATAGAFRLAKWGLARPRIFSETGRRL